MVIKICLRPIINKLIEIVIGIRSRSRAGNAFTRAVRGVIIAFTCAISFSKRKMPG